MKKFCLNCYRSDVPLDWKGLCNSCSVRGVDLGTRYDFWVLLMYWIWGFLFFTQFFRFDSMSGQFLADYVIGSENAGDMMFFAGVFYLLIYIIPSLVLKKRNIMIYYGFNIFFCILHPLYRIINFFN